MPTDRKTQEDMRGSVETHIFDLVDRELNKLDENFKSVTPLQSKLHFAKNGKERFLIALKHYAAKYKKESDPRPIESHVIAYNRMMRDQVTSKDMSSDKRMVPSKKKKGASSDKRAAVPSRKKRASHTSKRGLDRDTFADELTCHNMNLADLKQTVTYKNAFPQPARQIYNTNGEPVMRAFSKLPKAYLCEALVEIYKRNNE